MAKIFISYSSKDKDFVDRFAFDLISHGLPVWLDSWELEAGDSLYKKIYGELEVSSYVITVISKNYNKSFWTSNEFRAVLANEERKERKIIIPIVIDSNSYVPLEIADRVYSNFTDKYDEKILEITRFFRRKKITIQNIPIFERLIPISFDNHVHLDKSILIEILKDRDYQDTTKFKEAQIWLKDAPFFDKLRSKAKNTMKQYTTNQQLNEQFKQDLRNIEHYIEWMYSGIVIILNNYRKDGNIDFTSESIYWLYKQMIESLYIIFSRYIDLKSEYDIDTTNMVFNPFGNTSTNFCKFYGITDIRSLDLFDPTNTSDYFSFWIDRQNSASRNFNNMPFPDPLTRFWNVDLIYKYLIPQNVFSFLLNPKKIKLMTDFEKYHLGLH
ncbi:MAG: toll/interleukin-1 receptor domain-containing protein [Xenococcus sp. (in: cyanobacteria)]